MIEQLAQGLFEIWRATQTADTWTQLSESEREAWTRVARAVLCVPAHKIGR